MTELAVGKPWLMLGDCVERMRDVPDGFVDLTVTSPPYDSLRSYHGHSFDFEGVARELFRVTKTGGVVVWVVGDATVNGSETGTSFRQAIHFKNIGFNLHDTMIWRKKAPPPQTKVGMRYTAAFEYMFVLAKGRVGTFNPIQTECKTVGANSFRPGQNSQRKPDGGMRDDRKLARQGRVVNPTKPLQNVWDMPNQGQGALHPAQFPEQLPANHIVSWSNPGDTVLDPFLGSGTTGKMAVIAGRKFIGIEKSEQYLDGIARPRIAEAIAKAAQPASRGLFDDMAAE
jgi:site-specific DNA-methyltransferase (adenine-specific)